MATQRRSQTLLAAMTAAGRAALRRPDGITEVTRRLFVGLNVVTVTTVVPGALATTHGWLLLLAPVSAILLIASWLRGYVRHSAPFISDVFDALLMGTVAVTCPDPSALLGLVFSAVWFRSLYGSTRRSLVRAVLYVGALGASLPGRALLPGHLAAVSAAPIIMAFPAVLVTVVVASSLAANLRAREEGLRRDAALVSGGSTLLSVVDRQAIRQISWGTALRICQATPGVRLLELAKDGSTLRVVHASDGFASLPEMWPDHFGAPSSAEFAVQRIDKALDAAAGVALKWDAVSLAGDAQPAWFVIGSPKRRPEETTMAVSSWANQVNLALNSSTVHEQLIQQSRVDAMTGLANRSWFGRQLEARLDRLAVEPVHVLFIDLDGFKAVNDSWGHNVGDDLLVEVGQRLRRCTRSEDVCARFGGDEFAVVMSGLTDAAVIDIAVRMNEAIAEPIIIGGHAVRIRASIGTAPAAPGVGMEALIHQADGRMYVAKANQRAQAVR